MKKYVYPWAVLYSALLCVQLKAAELVEVKGVVSGISTVDKDNLVDGAVVLPSFSAEDLFQFQIDQFMGPSEEMTVGGIFKANVPSNFFFPKQKEKQGFFPVSFGKEHFSIFAMPGDKKELVAAWFQLPFDKLVAMKDGPSTAMLPLLKIKKHGFIAEKDWAAVPSINIAVDKALGTKLKYSWNRSALVGNDMDSLFLFQETNTARWVFANLKGNPAASGEIESMQGLKDSLKLLFMRTHTPEKDVTSAEGYIRNAKLADTVVVQNTPPALVAQLVSSTKITWEPIASPGWISLVLSPIKELQNNMLFSFDGILGGAFARADESEQVWLDPNAGQTDALLGSNDLSKMDIMLAFIGTSEAVPMPEEGADNTAFINSASEIRMKKLK